VRIPAGALLIVGGVLSILPFLGIWMLPLGLMLLAEDMPPLRRSRGRVLDWIARHRAPLARRKQGCNRDAGFAAAAVLEFVARGIVPWV
jgi:hypothetical protein